MSILVPWLHFHIEQDLLELEVFDHNSHCDGASNI
jgi:hypothetical protein